MKAILISIKPKYVAKILNGKKTIEIRKTMPKCDLPINVYIYCTKDNHQLVKPKDYDKHLLFTKGAVDYTGEHTLNGKVVAKFTLKEVEEIPVWKTYLYANKETCLSNEEIKKYLDVSLIDFELDENYVVGYAWYISNLEIFDKPKELGEFKRCTEKTCIYGKCHKYMHCLKSLTKAPQSWQFVESEK